MFPKMVFLALACFMMMMVGVAKSGPIFWGRSYPPPVVAVSRPHLHGRPIMASPVMHHQHYVRPIPVLPSRPRPPVVGAHMHHTHTVHHNHPYAPVYQG